MRARAAIVALVIVAAACKSDDAERARLQAQLDAMRAEIDALREELARRDHAARTPDGGPMLEQLPEAPAGLEHCTAFVATVRRYLDCPENVGAANREATLRGLNEFAAMWTDLSGDTRATMNDACRTANDSTVAEMTASGCK